MTGQAIEPSFPLHSLYLYLTDCCNLRCAHCWISPEFATAKQDGVPLAVLKRTLAEADELGLQRVKLTGGEPLLYREFKPLLEHLAAESLAITVETNGTLFDPEIVAACRDARVEQISVSLDGATDGVHDAIRGQAGCFKRTLYGISLLTERNLSVQVIMTLQRRNCQEISQMIQLCDTLGVGSLKINHLLPCGRGSAVFKRRDHLGLEELCSLYRDVEKERTRHERLQIIFDLPLAFRSIDEIKENGIDECCIVNILGILAGGDFSICGIGQTVKALRMGNLYRVSIRDVWMNHPVLKQLRRSLPDKLGGICGRCIFKFQCRGGCRANVFAVSSDLFAPYYLCQDLFDCRRFPASRMIA